MVIVSDRAVPMTSTFGSQSGGSRVAGYAKTVEVVDGGMNLSISAMPIYKDKSTEELRWEDYKSGDKGGIGFGGWATQSNFFTASRLSAKPASNPFSSSTSANIFAPKTLASASEGFGQSNAPAFSSFSPFGHSSSNPFSSDFGGSIAPAPSSSPFQASACPFTMTSSLTALASGKASASLFGAHSSEPSLGTSSLPTLGPTPSVFSSSSSLSENCSGTSTHPIFGAHNSSEFFPGEPTSSISSNLGVPSNLVSPPLFGQTTTQVPVSQSTAPSFGRDFSSTPGRCSCVCPSNMSNTAFTGNGSAGNLLSSTRLAFPSNIYGVGQATTSSSFPFKPMQTAHSTADPIGVPVGHLPGFNGFLGIAFLPCWIAFGQPVASPPGWVASAQSITAPVTCNHPFHGKVAGTSTTTNGSPKFGQSAFGGNRGGSREQAYTPTADPVDGCMLKSISAVPIYLNKSPEEIRWEDYWSGDKGGPKPGIGSFQTAPNPFSSSTPSNLFASKKPPFTLPKFGVPSTPIFGSSVFAAPYSACPFGQSFATPFSSTSANLFASQTPVFNSADLVSPTPSFVSPHPFGMQSEKPFSSSISTNSFAPSGLPCFASAAFGSSTTAPLASSVFSAPFSPSPFGSSVNPFSSSTPSIMFPPKSSSFGSSSFRASTAYPFTTTTSSTLCGFGTESGSGFVANGSAPSLGASCSPTLGSSPSVCSSSFTFGPSSGPIFKAPSTPVSRSCGSPLCGGPVPSIFSQFGSVAPNSVLPSAVSGESNFSFAPSIVPSFGALNISSTASTGDGLEGNLWSSTQHFCPTNTAGFDTTTNSAANLFQPVQTSESECVPAGNIDWSAAGDGSIAWNAFSPSVASKWGF